MSLTSILKPFAGSDEATIASLETKAHALRVALETAEQNARAAYLEAEKSGTDGAYKKSAQARDGLAMAQERLDRVAGALREARERKAAADAAKDQEATRKRQADARAALKRLAGAGKAVDQKIDELADALRAALAVQDALRGLADDRSVWDRCAAANMALKACISHKLAFMPGFGMGSAFGDERARWASYLPEVKP